MKKILLLFLLCCVLSLGLLGQSSADSSLSKQDDYYCWFHPSINKSPKKSVAQFATYTSFGFGLNTVKDMLGGCLMFSQTFAYKSWLLTYSQAEAANLPLDPAGSFYSTTYVALLLGQSVRGKHSLISLSVGLGYTALDLDWVEIPSGYTPSNSELYLFHHSSYGFYPSIPIEIKVFALAPNFVGGGFHLSYDIVPSKAAYSPFYFGFEFTLGKWNKLYHPVSRSQRTLKTIKTNHYAPFDNYKPKSKADMTVTYWGNYFYAGLGKGTSDGFKVSTQFAGYTVAFKSHILNFHYSDSYLYNELTDFEDITKAIMFGESFRFQYGMVSLTSGIGVSTYRKYLGKYPNGVDFPDKTMAVIPLELNTMIHFYNFFGTGLVLFTTFKSHEKNSYYVGFSVVAGIWNKNRLHWR